MKNLIFIILLLSPFKTVWALNNNREIEAMQLVKSLIMKLQANTPFSYSDEKVFFGETSIPSFIILSQLGYQNKAGKWLKTKPKYSYIGELLRQNSQLIIKKNAEIEIYASTKIFYSNNEKSEYREYISNTFVFVTLIWTANARESFLCSTKNNYKTILFEIMVNPAGTQAVIDIDGIIINGEPLAYLLGFRRKKITIKSAGKMQEKNIAYFPIKQLEELKRHLTSLRNEPSLKTGSGTATEQKE